MTDFEIIRFSTEAEPLFGGLVAADPAHIAQANAFVDGLRPIGGTAIEDALARATALRTSGGSGGRPYMVIFLTDGVPTVGETRRIRWSPWSAVRRRTCASSHSGSART